MLAHSLSPRPTSPSHSSLLSPPSTHIHRSRPPPTTTTSGGRESLSFSVPSPRHGDAWRRDSPSTPWGMSLSAPSPPPGPRAPSLVPPLLLPAKPAPVGLALAYPACSRTSAQPAHTRSPGPRVAAIAHAPPPNQRTRARPARAWRSPPTPAGAKPLRDHLRARTGWANAYPWDDTAGQVHPPLGPSSGTGQPPPPHPPPPPP